MKFSIPELIDLIYKIALFIYDANSPLPSASKFGDESNYTKFF